MAVTRVLGSAVEGEPFALGDEEFTIAAKCSENTGQWICVNHQQKFRNNFEKDGHIQEGTHVLAWLCFSHGAEVP